MYACQHPVGSNKCVLDMSVVPLYRVLCYNATTRSKIRAACPTILLGGQSESALLAEFCEPFSQALGTCGGGEYRFLDSVPFSPNGFVPQWTPDNEKARAGMPCLVNKLVTVFSSVRLFSLSGTLPPLEDTYLEAMTCAQVLSPPHSHTHTLTHTHTPVSRISHTHHTNPLRILLVHLLFEQVVY